METQYAIRELIRYFNIYRVVNLFVLINYKYWIIVLTQLSATSKND